MNCSPLSNAFTQEPLPAYREYPVAEMCERARWFYGDLSRRRTVRNFDRRPVPREVIEQCLLAAGTAPSGANHPVAGCVVPAHGGIKKPLHETTSWFGP